VDPSRKFPPRRDVGYVIGFIVRDVDAVAHASFVATTRLLHRRLFAQSFHLVVLLAKFSEQLNQFGVEVRLVLFHRQNGVGTSIDDCGSSFSLAMHRAERDHRTSEFKQLQHHWNRWDFIGFVVDRQLPQDELRLRREYLDRAQCALA